MLGEFSVKPVLEFTNWTASAGGEYGGTSFTFSVFGGVSRWACWRRLVSVAAQARCYRYGLRDSSPTSAAPQTSTPRRVHPGQAQQTARIPSTNGSFDFFFV
jgi:hypothetical protein